MRYTRHTTSSIVLNNKSKIAENGWLEKTHEGVRILKRDNRL